MHVFCVTNSPVAAKSTYSLLLFILLAADQGKIIFHDFVCLFLLRKKVPIPVVLFFSHATCFHS